MLANWMLVERRQDKTNRSMRCLARLERVELEPKPIQSTTQAAQPTLQLMFYS